MSVGRRGVGVTVKGEDRRKARMDKGERRDPAGNLCLVGLTGEPGDGVGPTVGAVKNIADIGTPLPVDAGGHLRHRDSGTLTVEAGGTAGGEDSGGVEAVNFGIGGDPAEGAKAGFHSGRSLKKPGQAVFDIDGVPAHFEPGA